MAAPALGLGVGAACLYALEKKYALLHDLMLASHLLPMAYLKLHMKEPGYNVLKFWNATLSKYPEKTAVIFENRRVSFADMERTSNQMAAFLSKQGVQKGATVALVMQNKPEFICWWLAITKLGAKVALINSSIKQKGLVHCIRVASSSAVVVDEECF